MPAPVVRSQTNRNHTPARPCLSKKEVIRSKLQVHRRTCNRILGRDEMDVSGLGSTRRRERSEIAAEGLTPNRRARSHQAGKFTKLASAYFFATHLPPRIPLANQSGRLPPDRAMAPMIISPPPVKDRDSSVCTNSQPTSVLYGCVLSDVNESRHMVYSFRDKSEEH